MKLTRILLMVLSFTLFTISLLAEKAPPPVKGFVKVDGKSVQLKHAIAFTGPAPFDESEENTFIYLTDKPITASAVEKAEDPSDLRKLLSSGIRMQLDNSSSAHITILHPSLGDDAISTGAGFGYKPASSGPDRYSGVLQSFGADRNEDEESFGHKLRYDLTYDVAVTRRFPVAPKIALSSTAKKLKAGGGEPGKAYLAECAKASNLPKNVKEFEKRLAAEGALPTVADLEEMSKERGKKVTRQQAMEMLFELMNLGGALAPTNCKVLGGGYDPNLAILQVEAVVFGSRSKTDVILEKLDGVWKVKKYGAWTPIQ